MKCGRCDSPVGETARYCENCGSALRGNDLVHRLALAHREEVAGRLAEAAEQYRALLHDAAGGAESAVVRKHLGNLHFRLGHLRSAREQLARACELDPGNGALWHDLGVVDYHMADFDRAIVAFRRARAADGELHVSLFWLGNALYHVGDHEAAIRAFQELIDSYPNFAIARFHLGVIHARMGDQQRAEEQFHKLLLHNPADVAARFYVSR